MNSDESIFVLLISSFLSYFINCFISSTLALWIWNGYIASHFGLPTVSHYDAFVFTSLFYICHPPRGEK